MNNNSKNEINSNQIVGLLNIERHVAQDLLMGTRKILGKGENAIITVKEFCKLIHLEESDVYNAIIDIS